MLPLGGQPILPHTRGLRKALVSFSHSVKEVLWPCRLKWNSQPFLNAVKGNGLVFTCRNWMRFRSGWTCPVPWPLLILMLGIGLFHDNTVTLTVWLITCAVCTCSLVTFLLWRSQWHCFTCLLYFKEIKPKTAHILLYSSLLEWITLSLLLSLRQFSQSFELLFIRESGLCKQGTIETGMKWGEANEWTPLSTVTYRSTLCGGEPSLTIEGFQRAALHLIVFPGSGNILFDC